MVEEDHAKLNAASAVFVSEYRGMSVASSPICAAPCARPAPSTRCTRTPWPSSPPPAAGSTASRTPDRPDRPHIRRRAIRRRVGQGAYSSRPRPTPSPGHQGRHAGRNRPMSADDLKALASSAAARRVAGEVCRRTAGTAGQDRRSAPGAAPQLRLRPLLPSFEKQEAELPEHPLLLGRRMAPHLTTLELKERTTCLRMKSSTQFPT